VFITQSKQPIAGLSLCLIATNISGVMAAWVQQAERAREVLRNSVRKEWLLSPSQCPPATRMNVLGVPEECGMLTPQEITITNSDATGLVQKMAVGEWTAEQVTIAYLKRATIGHQLVSICPMVDG